MKIVVIGGTGLIGTKVVSLLREAGHEAVPASPRSGVNTLTGQGLAEVMRGAAVVVDVSNSPSFETKAVRAFFETSTQNLLAAERAAGVGHHVALSVVGTDRLPESGYFVAKLAQERLIEQGGIPYSIVRATQFYEFVDTILDAATVGHAVHMPSALIQPMAAAEVARAVADVALAAPLQGLVDWAGPEALPLARLAAQVLRAKGDSRELVVDEEAGYFGTRLEAGSLVPQGAAQRGSLRFEDWRSLQ
jgi:uncharacterized protein YbjT (DUF2867 family)